MTKGGRLALYHCNYCSKDISNTFRIKCAVCLDFDLCMECFHVGAQVTPHRKTHAYTVVDNLGFPLFTPGWGTDEELLLLEAVEMYGLGNWDEVSEHVSTKTASDCREHYFVVYFGTDKKPLPDVDNILGPGFKKTTTATGTTGTTGTTGARMLRSGNVIDNPIDNAPTTTTMTTTMNGAGANEKKTDGSGNTSGGGGDGERPKKENAKKEEENAAPGSGKEKTNAAHAAAPGLSRETKPMAEMNDAVVVPNNKKRKKGGGGASAASPSGANAALQEQGQGGAQDQGQSPRATNAGISFDITGYITKREEFDVEHDPDAEVPLADLEIVGNEDEATLALKDKQLRFYYKRQQERYRRRNFVRDRNLLDVRALQAMEKKHARDELEAAGHYRVLARYLAADQYAGLVNGIMYEHHLRQRIDELKDLRRNGVTTLVEAEVYERMKRRRDADKEKVKAIEAGIASGSVGGKTAAMRANRYLSRDGDGLGPLVATNSLNRELNKLRTNGTSTSQLLASNMGQRTGNRKPMGTDMEIEGQPGCDAISSHERDLCVACKLLPLFYLSIKKTFVRESERRGSLPRADISRLVHADNSKLNRVYDFLLACGLVNAPS